MVIDHVTNYSVRSNTIQDEVKAEFFIQKKLFLDTLARQTFGALDEQRGLLYHGYHVVVKVRELNCSYW